MNPSADAFTATELARRRAAARRMAWAIGAAVLAVYIAGFFFGRG